MTIPAWLKPGAYGVAIGAVLASILGFSWGGWVTGGTASDMADTLAHEQVLSALVPVCINMSEADPDRLEKLAALDAASNFKRREAVADAGWATVPGMSEPDRDLARACAEALKANAT